MGVYILSNFPLGLDDLIRGFSRESPKTVDGVMNASVTAWKDRLYRIASSIFEIDGWNYEKWDYSYFLWELLMGGSICFTDTPMGVLPLRCSRTGVNVFDRPTTATFANHVLGNFERIIDVNCVLIKWNDDYSSIDSLLQRYATMLAMCDSSTAVTLMNSKAAFIGLAPSKAKAETMKKMFDLISSGQPAVFVKGNDTTVGATSLSKDDFIQLDVKQHFVGKEITETQRYIFSMFLSEFGIRNVPMEKRERLITSEADSNAEELNAEVSMYERNLTEGIKKVNEMFHTNMTVRFKYGREETKQNVESKQPVET